MSGGARIWIRVASGAEIVALGAVGISRDVRLHVGPVAPGIARRGMCVRICPLRLRGSGGEHQTDGQNEFLHCESPGDVFGGVINHTARVLQPRVNTGRQCYCWRRAPERDL